MHSRRWRPCMLGSVLSPSVGRYRLARAARNAKKARERAPSSRVELPARALAEPPPMTRLSPSAAGTADVSRDTPRQKATVAPKSRRLVIVSNRVAVAGPGNSAAGGLAVAILAALRDRGGMWFGWSGQVSDTPPSAPEIVQGEGFTYATLDLARQDFDEYYNGFANRVLWPLFHYRPGLIDYQRSDHAGYMRVNRQFAGHLAALLQPSDLIWVHDYHLLPLGDELRRLGVKQPIGFFLHTPFPAAEVFRILPNHSKLIRAMCAYDLIGFQTENDRE